MKAEDSFDGTQIKDSNVEIASADLRNIPKGNEVDLANSPIIGNNQQISSDQCMDDVTVSGKDAANENKKLWLEQISKVPKEDLMSYCNKMKVLVKIIDLAYKLREKVLVFSHRLSCLTLIEEAVKTSCTPCLSNEDYCRMDGRTSAELRQHYIDKFNSDDNSR